MIFPPISGLLENVANKEPFEELEYASTPSHCPKKLPPLFKNVFILFTNVELMSFGFVWGSLTKV